VSAGEKAVILILAAIIGYLAWRAGAFDPIDDDAADDWTFPAFRYPDVTEADRELLAGLPRSEFLSEAEAARLARSVWATIDALPETPEVAA
jgi:hypothetical protein